MALLKKHVVAQNGCWQFLGRPGSDGYGKLKIKGKTIRAHRAYYEHYVGTIPDGLWVLHHCDNPMCVNPEHLYVGTQADNERDKDARGRRPPSPSVTHPESLPRGVNHHRYGKGMPEKVAEALEKANKGRSLSNTHKENLSPLTAEQVVAIRADSRAQRVIAAEYGVGQMTISRIKRGIRWAHV